MCIKTSSKTILWMALTKSKSYYLCLFLTLTMTFIWILRWIIVMVIALMFISICIRKTFTNSVISCTYNKHILLSFCVLAKLFSWLAGSSLSLSKLIFSNLSIIYSVSKKYLYGFGKPKIKIVTIRLSSILTNLAFVISCRMFLSHETYSITSPPSIIFCCNNFTWRSTLLALGCESNKSLSAFQADQAS